MVEMPYNNENPRSDCFGGVGEFSSWNDPPGKKASKDNWKPDDESGKDHDPDGEEEKPIGKFLFEAEFSKLRFLPGEK